MEEQGTYRVIINECKDGNVVHPKRYGLFDGDGTILLPVKHCRISPVKYQKDSQVDMYDDNGYHKLSLAELRKKAYGYEENYDSRFDKSDNYGSHYGEFVGSYAQDVMGFSDDVINDAFEGDPDAYWNID